MHDQTSEQVLAELLEMPPEPARNQQLQQLLTDHPDLVSAYLAHLQLGALLHWRTGSVGGPKVPDTEPARPAPDHPVSRYPVARLLFLAAVLLLSVGGSILWWGLGASIDTNPNAAADDALVELLEYNLDLAEADSLDNRKVIHQRGDEMAQAMLATPTLSEEDRPLARSLLDNASWLVRNDDPVAEAERFSDIADQLLVRLESGFEEVKSAPRVSRLAEAYRRVSLIGVSRNLEKARIRPGARGARFDRLAATDVTRERRLEALADRAPKSSRKAVLRALHGHKRRATPRAAD